MVTREKVHVNFNQMPPADLVRYLVDVQQPYLLKALATFSLCGKTIIAQHTDETGSRLRADLLQKLDEVVHDHLDKDEKLFFSQLGQLSSSRIREELPAMLAGVRKQHAVISKLLKKLRLLSNEYIAPKEASATLRLCYAQLFNFEQDMLRHIFLKEDILFPKLLEASKLRHS